MSCHRCPHAERQWTHCPYCGHKLDRAPKRKRRSVPGNLVEAHAPGYVIGRFWPTDKAWEMDTAEASV